MADLQMRSALRTVEQGLKNQLLHGYGIRSTHATAAALRTLAAASLREDQLAYVTALAFTFKFDRESTATDNGTTVIKPTDGLTNGRWLVTTNTTTSGYAKAVQIHPDEDSYKTMLKRSAAVRPAIHIIFDSVKYHERTMSHGGLYWVSAEFKVRCVSQTYRSGAQAMEGSDITTEATADPGAHQMVGDVIASVAGSDLSVTGMAYCRIGDQSKVESSDAGRLYVEQVGITAFYTVQQPDTDLVTLDTFGALAIQRRLLGGGSAYDDDNVITSGYTIPTGSGFMKTPATGVGVINGTAVSSSPASVTFSANKDTYRDLHADGTFSYTAVNHGIDAPALAYNGTTALNTIRVGVTVTDGTGVIYDAMLAGTLVNYGAVDYVPTASPLLSIAVTPSSASIAVAATQQFTATATYSDGHVADISTVVAWTSSATSKATIDYKGLATGVSAGSSTISCTYDGVAAGNTAALTVT